MPDALIELLEAFVAEHHVEEPFVKRQRQKHHRAEEHKFGQEPIEVLRQRAAGRRARNETRSRSSSAGRGARSRRARVPSRATSPRRPRRPRSPRSIQDPSEATSSPAAGPQEKRELTEADFADVDFDALDAKSDYSRFLQAGVPESIKNKALRQLWMSDALYTTPDPFQDYLHDYTDAAVAVPPGTLKTAYRIGKGFLTDEEVAEWEKLGKPAEATNDATAVAKPAEGSQAAAAATSIGSEPQIAVAPETADQPEVHALLRQSDVYHAALYPAESNHLVDVAKLSSPNVRFVVARRDGIAVGLRRTDPRRRWRG